MTARKKAGPLKAGEPELRIPKYLEEELVGHAASLGVSIEKVRERVLVAYHESRVSLSKNDRWMSSLASLVPGKPAAAEPPVVEVAGRPASGTAPGDRTGGTRGGANAANDLVEIGGEVELFHDAHDDTYGGVTVGGHRETYRLRSRRFRQWLAREYWQRSGEAAGPDAIGTALTVLEAMALYDGPLRSVYARVAPHGDDVWLDLGDAEWRSVRVTAAGWSVEASAPVRFIRGPGALPLPVPVPGADLLTLLPFVNAQSPTDPHFVLSIAWLIGAFHPDGPYPNLSLYGEQGSGKTAHGIRLRSLVDPSDAPLRSVPREERDLAVTARHQLVLVIDNVSTLPLWLSDALCRLSTGGGFATRKLYTDDEEESGSSGFRVGEIGGSGRPREAVGVPWARLSHRQWTRGLDCGPRVARRAPSWASSPK